MDLLNSSIEGQVFYYLNYIFFILSLILVIPQTEKAKNWANSVMNAINGK